MATPTPNLGLSKLANGESPDAWDVPINTNWDVVDALFHATTGHIHDGTAGDGTKLDHTVSLTAVGVKTHAVLDTEVDANAASITTLNNTTAANTAKIAVLEAGPAATRLPGLYAPVVYVDDFNYEKNLDLSVLNYRVDRSEAAVQVLTTSDSAILNADTRPENVDFPVSGRYVASVEAHKPHSSPQRITLEVSRWDISGFTIVGDGMSLVLALNSAPLLGSVSVVKYGWQLVIDVTLDGTGPNTYTVSKRIQAVTASGIRDTFFDDTNSGLTEAAALLELLGAVELSHDEDNRLYFYHRCRLLFASSAAVVDDELTTPYTSDIQTDLAGESEPVFGNFTLGFAYTLSVDVQADIEIRHLAVAGTGDRAATDAKDVSALTNRTKPTSVPISGEVCAAAGQYAGTSVGDSFDFIDPIQNVSLASEVVACGVESFFISLLHQAGKGAGLVEIPTPFMELSGLPNNFLFALDDVAPMVTQTEPTGLLDGIKKQKIIVTGICCLHPSAELTLTGTGVTLVSYRFLSLDRVEVVLDIDAGSIGNAVTVDLTQVDNGSNTISLSLGSVVEAPLRIISESYELNGVAVAKSALTAGDTYDFTLKLEGVQKPTGAGAFPIDLTLFPSAFGITGTPAASLGAITASLTDFETIVGTFVLTETVTIPTGTDTVEIRFTNDSNSDEVTTEFTIGIPAPIVNFFTMADAGPGGPFAMTIVGEHFYTGAALAEIAVPGGATFGGVTVATPQLITTTITYVAGPPQLLDIEVTNTDTQKVNKSAVQVGLNGAPTITSVTVTPTNQEGQLTEHVQVIGTVFDAGANVTAPPGAKLRNLTIPNTPGGALTVDFDIDLPAGSGGSPLTVTVDNPSSIAAAAVDATNIIVTEATPTISAITPDNTLEPKSSGTLTIDGTNFFTGAVVSTTDTAHLTLGPTTVVSTIQITVPYTVRGDAVSGTTLNITVTNLGGTSVLDSGEVVGFPAPVIFGITFESERENIVGSKFVITGENFDPAIATPDLSVTIGSETTNVTVTSSTATKIEGTLDFAPNVGPVLNEITVTNPSDSQTDAVSYTILEQLAPRVTSVKLTPDITGSVGATLEINGVNLDPTATATLTAGVFSSIVSVSKTLTKWVYTLDITGAAGLAYGWDDGGSGGFDFGGRTYTLTQFGEIKPVAAGPPTIVSFLPVTLVENAGAGVAITITGTDIDASQVGGFRLVPTTGHSVRLPFEYDPLTPGAAYEVFTSEAISTQNPTTITGTIDFIAPPAGIFTPPVLVKAHGLGTAAGAPGPLDGRLFDLEILDLALTTVLDTLVGAVRITSDPAVPGQGWLNEAAVLAAIVTAPGAFNSIIVSCAAAPVVAPGAADIQGRTNGAAFNVAPTVAGVGVPGPFDLTITWTNPGAGGVECEVRIKNTAQPLFDQDFLNIRFST